MILPQLEGETVYNALNVQARMDTGQANAQSATAYYVILSTWLCPSDGKNGGGFLPSSTQDGNWSCLGRSPESRDRSHPVCGRELRRKLWRQLLRWFVDPAGWAVGNPVRDGPAAGNSADRLGRALGHKRKAPW